jgi:hypothetical protein
MRRAIAFILATQFAVVGVAHAQAAPASLYPGSVLRIGTLRGGHVSGQLFRSDAGSRGVTCGIYRSPVLRAPARP